jgi:hypothetical protein
LNQRRRGGEQLQAGLDAVVLECAQQNRRGVRRQIPRVNSGIMAMVTVALLAASGPATPSMALPSQTRPWLHLGELFLDYAKAQKVRDFRATGGMQRWRANRRGAPSGWPGTA